MTRLDQALSLFNKQRKFDLNQTAVCVQLMRDYLCKEAIWARALNIVDQLPFVNLPLAIDPKISPIPEYEKLSISFSHSAVEGRCCLYLLHWYRLEQDKPELIKRWDFSDPYLPLIDFFNRGGYFSTEHKVYVDINQTEGLHSGMVQNSVLSNE